MTKRHRQAVMVGRKARASAPRATAAGCRPADRSPVEAARTISEPRELLALEFRAAREYFGLERIAVFALSRERGVLTRVASSLPEARPAAAPREAPLRLPPAGPLSRCALRAEAVRFAPAAGGRRAENAWLRPLGPRVLLLPLTGRRGLRCWKELRCDRRNCPAHGAADARCWLISKTICRDGQQREPHEKLAWCLKCPIFGVVGVAAFGAASRQELAALAENPHLPLFAAQVSAVLDAAQTTQALLRLTTDLEARVAEAVGEFAKAQQAAARAEKLAATGRLAAGLAHEINNPLTIVSACLQSLKMGPDGASATRRNLARIEEGVRRISALTRGLLDFARESPLRLAETGVAESVRQAIGLLAPKARLAGVVVRAPRAGGGLRARLDRGRMQQVFVNLLLNAVAVTPRGGEVRVDVRLARNGRGGKEVVLVTVRDHGPGLSPEVMARLFDPFFTTRGEAGGTGLGLAVSRSIVETHGGTILAENAPGGGALFTIRLPRA